VKLVQPFSAEETTLNVAITDGNQVVASRFSTGSTMLSLYYCEKMHVPRAPTSKAQLRSSTTDMAAFGSMVASEPLGSDRSLWHEIPKNHIVHITPEKDVCEFFSCEQLAKNSQVVVGPHASK
jgi:predicted glutamine amidotransferase